MEIDGSGMERRRIRSRNENPGTERYNGMLSTHMRGYWKYMHISRGNSAEDVQERYFLRNLAFASINGSWLWRNSAIGR
jgi:hypothetical protein